MRYRNLISGRSESYEQQIIDNIAAEMHRIDKGNGIFTRFPLIKINTYLTDFEWIYTYNGEKSDFLMRNPMSKIAGHLNGKIATLTGNLSEYPDRNDIYQRIGLLAQLLKFPNKAVRTEACSVFAESWYAVQSRVIEALAKQSFIAITEYPKLISRINPEEQARNTPYLITIFQSGELKKLFDTHSMTAQGELVKHYIGDEEAVQEFIERTISYGTLFSGMSGFDGTEWDKVLNWPTRNGARGWNHILRMLEPEYGEEQQYSDLNNAFQGSIFYQAWGKKLP